MGLGLVVGRQAAANKHLQTKSLLVCDLHQHAGLRIHIGSQDGLPRGGLSLFFSLGLEEVCGNPLVVCSNLLDLRGALNLTVPQHDYWGLVSTSSSGKSSQKNVEHKQIVEYV